MTGEIIVESGLSWLRDRITQAATDRCTILQEGIADGVPQEEYRQMVGRYREAKRWRDIIIPEIFDEFQQADDAAFEQDALEEMP